MPIDLDKELAAVDGAFSRGDNLHGLQLLRALAWRAGSPDLLHRLAVVEEQIGDSRAALAAHLRCLSNAPANPHAYLYAGYCLWSNGFESEALEVFSLGADLEPGLLCPKTLRAEPGARATRRRHCAALLRRHFSELHRRSVGNEAAVSRIRRSIWVQTDSTQAAVLDAGPQRPHLFFIPELAPIAWYNSADFPWARELLDEAPVIAEEFEQALDRISAHGRPYLPVSSATKEAFPALAGSLNWTALDIYRDGVLNEQLAEHLPATHVALSKIPLYGLTDGAPYEVFFSLLRPGQRIDPHYGLSNHSLTVHLPILVPDNCRLTVAGESRPWRSGELMIFDDTFLHDAVNGSREDRVVLIFSVWNPQLSKQERDAVTRSFAARQSWLERRGIPDSARFQDIE